MNIVKNQYFMFTILIVSLVSLIIYIQGDNDSNKQANNLVYENSTVLIEDAETNGFEESHRHASYMVYQTATDLINDVELIITATYLGDSENYSTMINSDEEFALPNHSGYTLSEVKINKIVKPSKRNDFSKNDMINIIEPNYYVKENGKTVLNIWEDYINLQNGKEYVLFLNWLEEKNAYEIHALHQGKINIDGKDTAEEKVTKNNDEFKKLKDEVIKEIKDK